MFCGMCLEMLRWLFAQMDSSVPEPDELVGRLDGKDSEEYQERKLRFSASGYVND